MMVLHALHHLRAPTLPARRPSNDVKTQVRGSRSSPRLIWKRTRPAKGGRLALAVHPEQEANIPRGYAKMDTPRGPSVACCPAGIEQSAPKFSLLTWRLALSDTIRRANEEAVRRACDAGA